jgi:hypothetical protein
LAFSSGSYKPVCMYRSQEERPFRGQEDYEDNCAFMLSGRGQWGVWEQVTE